jgi:hypothetical protein
MLLRTAKSCGPDAPTLASSLRSCVGPTGLRQDISADDGGKRARSPGRARRKPLKPLRAGTPGDSGVLVVTRVRFYQYKVHTRPRVQRASGVPHALCLWREKVHAQLGRIAPRDRAHVFRALEIESDVRNAGPLFSGAVGINVTPMLEASKSGRSWRGFQAKHCGR